MALKEYLWRGNTYQIADEDLSRYPGAVPVGVESAKRAARNAGRKAATPKAGAEPKNKAANPSANKRGASRRKSGE